MWQTKIADPMLAGQLTHQSTTKSQLSNTYRWRFTWINVLLTTLNFFHFFLHSIPLPFVMHYELVLRGIWSPPFGRSSTWLSAQLSQLRGSVHRERDHHLNLELSSIDVFSFTADVRGVRERETMLFDCCPYGGFSMRPQMAIQASSYRPHHHFIHNLGGDQTRIGCEQRDHSFIGRLIRAELCAVFFLYSCLVPPYVDAVACGRVSVSVRVFLFHFLRSHERTY